MRIIILLIFCFLNLQAKSDNELGLSFNTLSGSGLNFNTRINNSFNLELTAFYFYLGENPPRDYDTFLNFGSELQFNFHKDSDYRFYTFLGTSYWNINEYFVEIVPVVNGSPREVDRKIRHTLFNYGLGVGSEIYILRDFSISLSISYQIQNSENSNFNSVFDRNPSGDSFKGLGYGISFRYRF